MTEKEKELEEKRREALNQITEKSKQEEGPIDLDRYERENVKEFISTINIR